MPAMIVRLTVVYLDVVTAAGVARAAARHLRGPFQVQLREVHVDLLRRVFAVDPDAAVHVVRLE